MIQMKIMFSTNIDPKIIKETDGCSSIYTNIYLDKNKQFPLIEVDSTEVVDMLNKLDITRFIYIKDDWACEVQNGTGNFFHKFKGVKYHESFDEEPFKNGYLDLYIKDKKEYV